MHSSTKLKSVHDNDHVRQLRKVKWRWLWIIIRWRSVHSLWLLQNFRIFAKVSELLVRSTRCKWERHKTLLFVHAQEDTICTQKESKGRTPENGIIGSHITGKYWCSGMVIVQKKSGAVHICIDFKPLNTSVLREIHPIPWVDKVLAQLTGSMVFSKLDANCGFWQIPLTPESRHLTTFITLFGRFHFNKLPFGISSAPEMFQRRMNTILDGLSGRSCLIDDISVFGRS